MLKKELGMLGALVLLAVVITTYNSNFLSAFNLQNLSRHIALLTVFAIGEGIVIISGGIDLSVGSVIGFIGLLVAYLALVADVPLVWALVIGISISFLIGLCHGLLITRLRLQPFIVTLGGMMVLRGLAQTLTEGRNLGFGPEFSGFLSLGRGSMAGVPTPVWIVAVLTVFFWFLLRYTLFGRYLYAVGGNPEATRYCGINVESVQIGAYLISAVLAGLAGILYAAYLPSASPSVGIAYELYAVAAAVLGGCSLRGGEGSVLGVLIGAAIMRVMSNGIVLLGISTFWENTVIGAVILTAVILDRFVQTRRK